MAGVDQLHPDDRTAMRNTVLSFNKEFEQVISEQRDYCVADAALAEEVRGKVREEEGEEEIQRVPFTGESSDRSCVCSTLLQG